MYLWSYATTPAEARVGANWVLEQLRNYDIDYPAARTKTFSRQGSVDGIKGQCDCSWSYVGYAAKIKRLGLNKPKTYYKLTCEKTVEKSELAKVQAQLRAMGFEVSTKEE